MAVTESTSKRNWKRVPFADRYKLISGEFEIVATALGHDEKRSFYLVRHLGKTVGEFDRLSEAKEMVGAGCCE
jgi:hypothetical protein